MRAQTFPLYSQVKYVPPTSVRAVWQPNVHAARGLAILAIILVHCVSTSSPAPHTISANIGPLLRDISGFFVFISGYLFQYFLYRFYYATYLWRKTQTVVLPYLITSIPAVIFYLLALKGHPWLPPSFFHQPPLQITAFFLLTGTHLGPLWFIPTLVLYFLAAPLFAWIDENPKRYWLILPALFLSIMVPRAPHDGSVLQSVAHFLVAYLIGMAASRFANGWTDIGRRHVLALGLIGLGICGVGFATGVDSVQLAFKLPLFFAVLMLLLRFPPGQKSLLNRLATLSFGLYFVHGYIIAAVRMVDARIGQTMPANIASIAVLFLLVTLISWAIVEGVKAVLGGASRYIIGA